MSFPQIVIQKAYFTLDSTTGSAPLTATLASAISPTNHDQMASLLYPDMGRFTSEPGSGIVCDPVTGLMWAEKETDELAWDAATAACSECRLGGFTDWRMPTRNELLTIVDLERFSPALPPIFESKSDYVWTSTQTPWTKDKAGSARSFFVVGMGSGSVGSSYADDQLRARPVRRASPASQ